MQTGDSQTLNRARTVLAKNDRGSYTMPAAVLYTHQWLWDSCFTALGLAAYKPRRAAAELLSLFEGQWQNGMLPHMLFRDVGSHFLGPGFWRSRKNLAAPRHIETSGITQPPLPAIAALEVADKLPPTEAQVFLKQVYPALLNYHSWLYRERDPENRGLVALLHSWESGVDNSPVWIEVLKHIPNPLWLATFLKLKVDKLTSVFRSDTQALSDHERVGSVEAIRLLHRAIILRNHGYDSHLELAKNHFVVEDLLFNSVLIAANQALFDIATTIGEDLPSDLSLDMRRSEQALEELWDESSGQYYSRNFRTQKLITTSTAMAFMPLLTGAISPERAERLRLLLSDRRQYAAPWPVPSAALSSPYFDQHRYWQGPTWISANWLVIRGLENYGFTTEATALRMRTLQLIEQNGFYEYFSPLTGQGLGVADFSWTAALYIHLSGSG